MLYFFVLNVAYSNVSAGYLEKGIDLHAGNAILLKANQIGTVSEMIKTIMLAKKNNYKTIREEFHKSYIKQFKVKIISLIKYITIISI